MSEEAVQRQRDRRSGMDECWKCGTWGSRRYKYCQKCKTLNLDYENPETNNWNNTARYIQGEALTPLVPQSVSPSGEDTAGSGITPQDLYERTPQILDRETTV